MHVERQLPRTTRAAAATVEATAVEWMQSASSIRRDRGLIAAVLLDISKAVVPQWVANDFWAAVPSTVRRQQLADVAEFFRSTTPIAVGQLLDARPE